MNTQATASRPLTKAEFAEAIGISPRNVDYLISRGEVRSFKIGRLRRIPVSEVEDYPRRLLAANDPGADSAAA